MAQFSDDLYVGTAFIGGSNVSAGPAPMTMGVGPVGRVYCFDVVALTKQAAQLAASANPGSGASFTLIAGTGVTSRVRSDGTTEYVLDTPRNVSIAAAGANTATYLVTGYDQYGQKMSETFAAPSTSTVSGKKAFKTVISVTNNNATAGTNGLTVGYGDTLGLPLRVTDAAYVTRVGWNNVLAEDAGTFTKADVTDPATTSTGDVRGTYLPSEANNGSKRLVIVFALPALAVGPSATRVGAAGVTQV